MHNEPQAQRRREAAVVWRWTRHMMSGLQQNLATKEAKAWNCGRRIGQFCRDDRRCMMDVNTVEFNMRQQKIRSKPVRGVRQQNIVVGNGIRVEILM